MRVRHPGTHRRTVQLAVVEGIEKALNQNSLYWMVNGDAELDREAELPALIDGGGTGTGAGNVHGSGPGSEIKDICLRTIRDVVRSVEHAGDDGQEGTAPTPAPAALQLLQQFDMLEQQNIRNISLRASEELAATSRAGEAAALEEVKLAAEVGFISDADNIVMQNAQADILDTLHARLRELEQRQWRLVGAVTSEFDRRRKRMRREVKYLLPHMRQMEDVRASVGGAITHAESPGLFREEVECEQTRRRSPPPASPSGSTSSSLSSSAFPDSGVASVRSPHGGRPEVPSPRSADRGGTHAPPLERLPPFPSAIDAAIMRSHDGGIDDIVRVPEAAAGAGGGGGIDANDGDGH